MLLPVFTWSWCYFLRSYASCDEMRTQLNHVSAIHRFLKFRQPESIRLCKHFASTSKYMYWSLWQSRCTGVFDEGAKCSPDCLVEVELKIELKIRGLHNGIRRKTCVEYFPATFNLVVHSIYHCGCTCMIDVDYDETTVMELEPKLNNSM